MPRTEREPSRPYFEQLRRNVRESEIVLQWIELLQARLRELPNTNTAEHTIILRIFQLLGISPQLPHDSSSTSEWREVFQRTLDRMPPDERERLLELIAGTISTTPEPQEVRNMRFERQIYNARHSPFHAEELSRHRPSLIDRYAFSSPMMMGDEAPSNLRPPTFSLPFDNIPLQAAWEQLTPTDQDRVYSFLTTYPFAKKRGLHVEFSADPQAPLVIEFILSAECIAWREKDSLPLPDDYDNVLFASYKDLKRFVSHPARTSFISHFSPKGLLDLFNNRFYYEENPSIEKCWNFYFSFPDMIPLEAHQTSNMEVSKFQELPWSQRIEKLEEIATALQTFGARDQEVSAVLFNLWNPIEDRESVLKICTSLSKRELQRLQNILHSTSEDPTELVDTLFATTANNPQIVKKALFVVFGTKIFSSIQKGTPLESRHKIRAAIRKNKDSLHIPYSTSDALKMQIDYEESLYHPLGNLRTSTGNEIEYSPTVGMGMIPLHLLSFYGFHLGGGGGRENAEGLVPRAEYAAGPFISTQTGIIVHQAWIDNELLHVHQADTRTLHQSAGVNSQSLYGQWVRAMQLTGWTFAPDLKKYEDETHYLSIYEKTGSVYTKKRLESKNFRYLTPASFNRHVEIAVPSLAALKAYETAVRCYLQRERRSYHPDSIDYKNVPITNKIIRSLPLSKEEKALALLWLRTLRKINKALTKIQCQDWLSFDVPGNQARKIAQTVNRVYTSAWERDDAAIVEQDTVEPIRIGKRRIPNIVAFAQVELTQTANDAQKILDLAEQAVLVELAKISQLTVAEQKKAGIVRFFRRFSWHIPERVNLKNATELDLLSLEQRFSQLVVHAQKFNKLSPVFSPSERN